jgi:hypothetical protein
MKAPMTRDRYQTRVAKFIRTVILVIHASGSVVLISKALLQHSSALSILSKLERIDALFDHAKKLSGLKQFRASLSLCKLLSAEALLFKGFVETATFSIEFDTEDEKICHKQRLSIPAEDLEPAIASIGVTTDVSIRHTPELRGGFAQLAKKGIIHFTSNHTTEEFDQQQSVMIVIMNYILMASAWKLQRQHPPCSSFPVYTMQAKNVFSDLAISLAEKDRGNGYVISDNPSL